MSLVPTLVVLFDPDQETLADLHPLDHVRWVEAVGRLRAVWRTHAEAVAAGEGYRLEVTEDPEHPGLQVPDHDDARTVVEERAQALMLQDLEQIDGGDVRTLLLQEGHDPEAVEEVVGRYRPSIIVGGDVRLQGSARIFTLQEVETMREGLRAPEPSA